MRVLQANYRVPKFGDAEGVAEYVTKRLKQSFYDELDAVLSNSPGGVLLGPPDVTERTDTDRFGSGYGGTTTYSISATCEELPAPPEYRLIGGPVDGRIVRTRGERMWLVPYFPAPPSYASYTDLSAGVSQLVAEYERQGDTSAYFYRRTREA